MKAHIKREFVDLTEVPRYFESLKLANKSGDYKLSSIAFSTICHLIKRVGMQDPHILRNVSKIVLPILVNRLLDPKPNFRSQAKKSLETFWLATPTIVEAYLKDSALIHSNQNIRSESIVFISDLIDLNKHFNFTQFLPNLVNLLRDDSIDVLKNTEVLLIKYYILNKSKSHELVKEFKNQKIDQKAAISVLKEVDLVAANSYASEIRAQATTSRSTIDSFNNLAKSRGPRIAIDSKKIKNKPLASSEELSDILGKVPTAKLDESIQPKMVMSAQELQREVESLLPPFNGKETEFNWGNREKNIIKFRALIIGNAEKYPDALVQATRALSEGISKSITSLRTTLSSNGCQLVKEISFYLTKHIDPIAEQLFLPLASVTSATKKIASLNAFGSLCILLANTSYSNRLFNQCYALYQDKSVQPRLYSSTFLQIFITKHANRLDQQNLDNVHKWVFKGVSDPNITVRESMRTTFWVLYRKFPQLGENIISKHDLSVKKALERSKPSDITAPQTIPTRSSILANERKRPSVREFVASKQRERRSTSDSSTLNYQSRENSELAPEIPNGISNDMGKPNRIGVPQRVRVSSSGNSQMLPRQLSKGARSSSLNSHLQADNKAPEDSSEAQTGSKVNEDNGLPDKMETMRKLLRSPLTRERIEGIHLLGTSLTNGIKPTGLSSILTNLIVLDSILVKPLLKIPKFYDLIDITLLIKVLAVNKENITILQQKFNSEEIIKALNAVIKSLETLQFDNAPSTMFHIKYKNTILNFSVIHLYQFVSADDFASNDDMLQDICRSIFPLSISDYPRYDELVVQLYELNGELFETTLNNCSAYIKSKIHIILKDFKENVEEKQEVTEFGLGEMTMINPLNKKPTDPTTSIKPGFGTDMTMIMPTFKAPIEKENTVEEKDLEVDDLTDKKVDYMSDIFGKSANKEILEGEQQIKRESFISNKSTENTERVSTTIENKPELKDQSGKEEEIDDRDEDGDVEIKSEPIEGSPFLENPEENDELVQNVQIEEPHQENGIVDKVETQLDNDGDTHIHSDEATRNITDKISGIHISPQKKMNSTNLESISQIITQTDPFFNKMKRHIKIFQDEAPKEQTAKKLTDFELSRFGLMCSYERADNEDQLISSILVTVKKFDEDNVGQEEMDNLIKCLHKAINKEEVLDWMKNTGFKPILLSMIKYFNTSVNITKQMCFKGLIIFKEMIILGSLMTDVISLTETVAIWNILVMVVENLKSFKNEIYIAADELVDEILELNIINSKSTIRNSCYSILKEGDINNVPVISFLMMTIIKCIEHEMLSLDQIKEVDDVVFRYLSSDEVEVRRLTIITYSKCKNKLQLIDSNSNQKNINGKLKLDIDSASDTKDNEALNHLFDKLSMSQQRLVDYYCDC